MLKRILSHSFTLDISISDDEFVACDIRNNKPKNYRTLSDVHAVAAAIRQHRGPVELGITTRQVLAAAGYSNIGVRLNLASQHSSPDVELFKDNAAGALGL